MYDMEHIILFKILLFIILPLHNHSSNFYAHFNSKPFIALTIPNF